MKSSYYLTLCFLFITGIIFQNHSEAAVFTVSSLSALQTALNTAATNGESDTVILQNGTYNVTSTISYSSSEGYSITLSGQDSTILDGGDAVRPLEMSTSAAGADIIVKNLTVRNGRDDYGGGVYLETTLADISLINCNINNNTGNIICGGADIYSESGDVLVSNCSFENNSAPNTSGYPNGTAGGLFIQTEYAGTTITLTDSHFSGNTAQRDAGGAMLYPVGANATVVVTGNRFENDTAQEFGGGCWIRCPNSNSSIEFRNNTVNNNQAATAGSGGGSYFEQEGGTLTVTGNTHTGNSAAWQGGGMWISNNGGSPDIHDNTFVNNSCSQDGGGLYCFLESGTATLHHNVFRINNATNAGGGMNLATTSGACEVYNNTFYSDTASDGGDFYGYFDNASATINFYQNILYQSSSPALSYSGAISMTATYSDIQGGTGESWFGTGCFDNDPLFADPANGDLHLTWSGYPSPDATKSPCIDSGDPSSPTDPDYTVADVGAYYYDQPFRWTGNTGNSWNEAGNWSSNHIPTSTHSVIIPAVTTVYPIINTVTAVCKNLTVEQGAQLTLDPGATLTLGQNSTMLVGKRGKKQVILRIRK